MQTALHPECQSIFETNSAKKYIYVSCVTLYLFNCIKQKVNATSVVLNPCKIHIMSLPRAGTAIALDLITSAWSSKQRLTTYSCRAPLWWPSKGAAICVGQVFMSSSWKGRPAREDLAMKTDGWRKKEETIKLGRPCWVSPYGWMNYRRLVKLNVRKQHIMSD